MTVPSCSLGSYRPTRNIWSISLLVCLTLSGCLGCSYLCEPDTADHTAIGNKETIYLNDSVVVPSSIPVTGTYDPATYEEISNSTRINQLAPVPVSPAPQTQTAITKPAAVHPTKAKTNQVHTLCPEPLNNDFKKSIAFVSFSRSIPVSSSLGALHQVEQQLPLLMGTNLTNRHMMPTPTYLRESFTSANLRGEINAAAQAQTLSKQNRVQFFVSGEIDDMSMTFPATVEGPSYYTRFVNGTHNLLHINTPLDKRSRIFSFKVEVRDGFTGQIVFSNRYQTFGKWKASPKTQMGFGSPRFWETDYGIQVQHLVTKASDDMASAISCQPYMARVDAQPGQQQIVIHSGASNGMHSGDTLDLYQLIYQPITGEYQRFDTRLVKRNGLVRLTEIYPSHSIGQVVNDTLLSGQYLVKAR